MPKNYTVVYSHPNGATATFIYEDGELSALAKGLDSEQFWVFKQVKSHLLRNEEDDLAISAKMMADIGFSSDLMRPLPSLLAKVPDASTRNPNLDIDDDFEEIHYRSLPSTAIAFFTPAQTVSEIHWREGRKNSAPKDPPAPHRAPPVTVKPTPKVTGPIQQYSPKSSQTVSEIHWREGEH